MIIPKDRNQKKEYRTYFFLRQDDKISQIQQCNSNNQIYSGKNGFYRRVNVKDFGFEVKNSSKFQQFIDTKFKIDLSKEYQSFKTRRLFDAYEKQMPIFENLSQQGNQIKESFINYQKQYNSFLAEFGLIDKIHLQSIFLTRNINKKGYYQYFVRRNGQYYLQYIDDQIPVYGPKREPIWGLSYRCPWQLLLLKAWIKQKNGLQNVKNAEPYQFLYAFGLPGYSKKHIKKQLDFLKKDTSEIDLKKKKQEKLPLNRSQFTILAKTRNDNKIETLGLIKNCLGYKITPIKPSKSMIGSSSKQKTIYKVHSTIPTKWIGSLSVINNNPLLKEYEFSKYGLNLQKQFLATQQQILTIFSQFYLARDYYSQFKNGKNYQDSYLIKNSQKNQAIIYLLNVQQNGVMNINIENLQQNQKPRVKGHQRWPYIKYFLSKIPDQLIDQANLKSGEKKRSFPSEKGILNSQFEPNLTKYQCYDIQFIKGYNRSVNRFLNIQKGQYLMYVKIQKASENQEKIDYSININSSARFSQLSIQNLSASQHRQLVDSTIFQYAKNHGQKYVKDRIQHIYLGNTFKQIGFGFMALQLKQANLEEIRNNSRSKISENPSKSKIPDPKNIQIGIRVYPQKFKKLDLAASYYQQKDGTRSRLEANKQPITMVSKVGFPKIIVFQNPQYNYQFEEQFPEPGCVQVYSLKKR